MKFSSFLALFTFTSLAAHAAVTPEQAFGAIKSLKGDWHGPAAMKGMPPSHSVFRVTAGGSAVEETIFPGSPMEMLSVYHMDKGNLLMTHYCAIGNQPRMKLNAKKSTPQELVFDFDGGTNLNPRRTFSRLAASNDAICGSSCANARTSRAPEKFSCACAEISENIAWMRSKRSWILRPIVCTSTLASGSGTSATSVRNGLMRNRKMTAPIENSTVLALYMIAGPSNMRTAFRSFVMRAMMSPVRCSA